MGNIISHPLKMAVVERHVAELVLVLENSIVAHLFSGVDNKYTYEELAMAHTQCATAALRTSFRLTHKLDDDEEEEDLDGKQPTGPGH